MKCVYVTTNRVVSIKEVHEKTMLAELQQLVGGYIEVVRPRWLRSPYLMIVNEEGHLKGLPENFIGCMLYESISYDRTVFGSQIVGDIVIMKSGYNADGEPDIVGLNDKEAAEVFESLQIFLLGGIK